MFRLYAWHVACSPVFLGSSKAQFGSPRLVGDDRICQENSLVPPHSTKYKVTGLSEKIPSEVHCKAAHGKNSKYWTRDILCQSCWQLGRRDYQSHHRSREGPDCLQLFPVSHGVGGQS